MSYPMLQAVVLWEATPCSNVEGHCFRGPWCLHHKWLLCKKFFPHVKVVICTSGYFSVFSYFVSLKHQSYWKIFYVHSNVGHKKVEVKYKYLWPKYFSFVFSTLNVNTDIKLSTHDLAYTVSIYSGKIFMKCLHTSWGVEV